MSFSNPLGFIVLAAIPVLIIIYIIKSKYTEQTIPSTYLWELSERFLKRKNPLKSITGLISLILQILAVIFIALAVAGPVFVLEGRANDYCFILDASASMNIVSDGNTTRFDEGKSCIENVISSSVDGSTYTLIAAGDTAEVVFDGEDEKRAALSQLDGVSCSFAESDLNAALTQAQKIFNINNSTSVYVVTDKEFETKVNVTYVGVTGGTSNYALDDVAYEPGSETLVLSGTAYSYSGAAELTVEVYKDGAGTPLVSIPVSVPESGSAKFSAETQTQTFSSLKFTIKESDSLAADNVAVIYGSQSEESYETLLVSRSPFLIKTAIAAAGNLSCTAITPEQYASGLYSSGYSLYIFDSESDSTAYAPDSIPTDGAVWFINPSASVAKTGFTYRGEVTFDSGAETTFSTSTSTRIKTLLKGTSLSGGTSDTALKTYVKCGLNRTFYTLLYCNSDPVVFAGSNEYGNREVVFAFDFNNSDFALSYSGRALIKNLLTYTFPTVLDGDETYYSGDTVSLNVVSGCTGLTIISPSGEETPLDTSETICEYQLTETGEYKVIANIGTSGQTQTSYLYALFPQGERSLKDVEKSFVISGEAGDEKRDGRYEDLLYLFIILGILIIADWAVYCYEQYQLR